MNIGDFQETINYHFKDTSLLHEALTHPSFNNSLHSNYQRLEFLGDKVLGAVIAEYFMLKFLKDNEGELSKKYAYIASSQCLADIAIELRLDSMMKLGKGEDISNGRLKKINLENCLEALIGAIFVDSGFSSARDFVIRNFYNKLENIDAAPTDPISQFQEYVQSKIKSLPQVIISKVSGSDHDPIFQAQIIVKQLGIDVAGEGGSKKEANKNACKKALDIIEQS